MKSSLKKTFYSKKIYVTTSMKWGERLKWKCEKRKSKKTNIGKSRGTLQWKKREEEIKKEKMQESNARKSRGTLPLNFPRTREIKRQKK